MNNLCDICGAGNGAIPNACGCKSSSQWIKCTPETMPNDENISYLLQYENGEHAIGYWNDKFKEFYLMKDIPHYGLEAVSTVAEWYQIITTPEE